MQIQRMNYQQNIIKRAMAATILADRAGLEQSQKEILVKRATNSSIKTSKRDNFKRLANIRVKKAIKSIKTLTHTANTSRYSYKKDDVSKILKAITGEIYALKKKFKN
jgi:hypothetical protein